MTLCVAALCDHSGTVVAASDRMLTAGDIQFEPPQAKVLQLTSSIVLLIAGDSAMQAEVYYRVFSDVQAGAAQNPQTWWKVADVANLYGQHYDAIRHQQAAKSVLSPLGLNGDSFIQRQREMDTDLIRMLATEMLNFDAPTVETLVVGVDEDGAHIYLVENGRVSCQDNVGFASIGAGYAHANSQLMVSRFSRYSDFSRALTLVYAAKKRGEVAPGVGAETDMFMIGPRLGTFSIINTRTIAQVDTICQELFASEKQAVQYAEERMGHYVQEITSATTAKDQSVQKDDRGDTPSDQEDVQDGSGQSELPTTETTS